MRRYQFCQRHDTFLLAINRRLCTTKSLYFWWKTKARKKAHPAENSHSQNIYTLNKRLIRVDNIALNFFSIYTNQIFISEYPLIFLSQLFRINNVIEQS